MRVGSQPESGHFVGSTVTVWEGLGTATDPAPLVAIDGQQRLTKVMLLLEALARHLPSECNAVPQFSPAKIPYYFCAMSRKAAMPATSYCLPKPTRKHSARSWTRPLIAGPAS